MEDVIPYTPLCELSEKYGTDKRPEPKGHGYTHYYHYLLAERRETVRKVMEIGIDTGASLRMWEEYFPHAIVCGLDCDRKKFISGERVMSFFCDQANLGSLYDASFRVGEGIDFAVDDGSHVTQHQIDSAMTFVPQLSSGGIYVIEDVLDSNTVVSKLPYICEVVPFLVKRDPYSKLVVIRAN